MGEMVYSSIGLNNPQSLACIKSPMIIYLKVTNRCMLHCKFCSQPLGAAHDLDIDFARSLLVRLRKIGVVYLYITGGEPLLYPHISELSKYAYELGFQLVLVTNGLLLNKSNTKSILKYYVAIGVSLHGPEQLHNSLTGVDGCYSKVVANLLDMSVCNPALSINVNYTATNENNDFFSIAHIAELCRANGFSMTVARLNYIGLGLQYNAIDINSIAESIDKLVHRGYNIRFSNCVATCLLDDKYKHLSHGCGAGHILAAIEANGDVKICASSNYVLGNLKKQSFESIWDSKILRNYRLFKWIPPQCKVCQDLVRCKCGCKAELSGAFWKELCDEAVTTKFNYIWAALSQKKLALNFNEVRKEPDGYTTVSLPARFCNEEVLRILKRIDGTLTGNELVDIFESKYDKRRVIDLLVALKLDNLIMEDAAK